MCGVVCLVQYVSNAARFHLSSSKDSGSVVNGTRCRLLVHAIMVEMHKATSNTHTIHY